MASNASAPSVNAERWWLAGILAVATLARFWRFWALPLTYDEYSTWNRIFPDWNNNGFPETPDFIEAVAMDAHPMLHHAWYRLLGEIGLLHAHELSIFILKLPFLLAGVGAVWLSYVAAKRWISSYAGLLTALCLAIMQPAVIHAQIARPYALGLLFVLALAVSLKGVVDGKKRSVLFSGLWLALAMYSHYFSGLTAIGLGVAVALGFREKFKPLLLVAGVGILLFSPHLPLTLEQFGHGDLGTVVQAPGPGFIADHLAYSFNRVVNGWVLLGIVGVVLVAGWVTRSKVALISIAVWAFPLVVGGAYSLLVGPILQHRVLLFGLPFLLGGIFAVLDAQPLRRKWVLPALILLGIGWRGLLVERAHYHVFYEREYLGVWEGVLWGKNDAWNRFRGVRDYSNDDCSRRPEDCETYSPGILSGHPFILGHTIHQYWGGYPCYLDAPFEACDSTSRYIDFRTYLDSMRIQSDCAFIGLTGHYDRPKPEFLAMVVDEYPDITEYQGYHNGAWYWLKRRELMPELTLHPNWNFGGNEWGEVVSLELDSLPTWHTTKGFGWCFFKSHITPSTPNTKARLVLNFKREDETVHSRIVHAADFALPGDTAWDVFVGGFYEDIRRLEPTHMEVFWWNPEGEDFTAGPLELRTLPRNRYQYGLTEPIDHSLPTNPWLKPTREKRKP